TQVRACRSPTAWCTKPSSSASACAPTTCARRSPRSSSRAHPSTRARDAVSRFRVRPNGPLVGRVEVAGATKNSGVKQMAAALLAPGVTTLRNMPPVLDLYVMSDLLRAVGAVVDRPEPNVVRIDASESLNPEA